MQSNMPSPGISTSSQSDLVTPRFDRIANILNLVSAESAKMKNKYVTCLVSSFK